MDQFFVNSKRVLYNGRMTVRNSINNLTTLILRSLAMTSTMLNSLMLKLFTSFHLLDTCREFPWKGDLRRESVIKHHFSLSLLSLTHTHPLYLSTPVAVIKTETHLTKKPTCHPSRHEDSVSKIGAGHRNNCHRVVWSHCLDSNSLDRLIKWKS